MKNTNAYLALKNNLLLKSTMLFSLFVLFSFSGMAQSNNINFTLVQQPCNNDGVLAVSTTGLTPPTTITYYIGGSSVTVTITGTVDTIFNYSGGYVYAYGQDINNVQGFGNFSGAPPFTYNVTSSPAVCPALGSATATVTGGTSPYTFQWIDVSNGSVVSTTNPASLPAGSYHVLITDAAGCVFGSYANSDSIWIWNSSSITFDVVTTTANCTDGSATVSNLAGGINPYGYEWSNGANTSSISNLQMGQVLVTVTDAQGCYQIGYGYIQQGITIGTNPTSTPATCLQNDGSSIAFGSGGTPPYAYSWSNGQQTQTASGLVAGYYTVTVTDANNCIGQGYAFITASTPITVTYSSTASSCTSPTGTATVTPAGGTTPYTINWNTYPPQSGVTATTLSSGTYSFQVTDAVGCVRTGTVYVPPISIITASINTSNAFCTQSNGAASTFITSGAPPYAYAWSNGATTSSISNLTAGGYSCVITDNLGCSVTKYGYVQVYSPVGISLAATPASCIFNSDGNIVATAYGGTLPYTYSWSNGQTTATASSLAAGYYSVYVSDAAGCNAYTWTNLGYDAGNNSCYCTITGTVYDDVNGNCIQDGGEAGIQNIMIHASGLGYAFTDANGVYAIIAPTGTYTLSESVQYYYPLAACQNNAVPVTVTAASGCTSTVDFANVINPIHDVQIATTSYWPPIPGNVFNQQLVVANNGTLTESGINAGYTHDGQLNLSSFSPSLFTQQNAASYPNWYSVTSGFTTLSPAATQGFNVQYNVPTNIPLGTSLLTKDTVSYSAPISNWLSDYTPWNNVDYYTAVVVGSWDPNFKEVNPKGTGVPGYITTDDSVLNYTIHFQNTGTYAAQKVVVIDTLDSDVKISSLKPIWSNHSFKTTVTESGIVTFTFDNINLPDSTSSPLGSIGIIMYSIHQKPNLTNGTQIKNAASIYFDYNEPVKTNTTLNTIDNGSGVTEINSTEVFDLTVYPNPTTNSVYLLVNSSTTSASSSVKFYNILGTQVLSQNVKLEKGKNVLTTDVTSLAAGMYFVEITEGTKSVMKKISIVK